MLDRGNEGDGVGSELGIVARGDSECSEEDSELDEEVEEQAFAVLEFAEESEEGDNVEEANVESLISFNILCPRSYPLGILRQKLMYSRLITISK